MQVLDQATGPYNIGWWYLGPEYFECTGSMIITALKRSLRRLCFYRFVSVHSGGCPGKKAPLQGDPPPRRPHSKETPLQGDPPSKGTPSKETPLQGDPPSKGTPSKETPLQGDPQGDPPQRKPPQRRHPPSGGSDPGPHPRGTLRGIRSRPTPKGEIEGGQDQTPPTTTTAVGGTHPTGMHTCYLVLSHLFI